MNTEIKETSTLSERLKEYSKGVPLKSYSKKIDESAVRNPLFAVFIKDLSAFIRGDKNFDESYMAKNLIIMMCLFRLNNRSPEYHPLMESDPYFSLNIIAEFLEPMIDKSIWDRYSKKLYSHNDAVFCELLANMITSEYSHINVEIDDFGMKITHVNDCQEAA